MSLPKHMSPRTLLKRLRSLGLSQAAFAKEIHKSRRTLTRWANGRTPVPYAVGVILDTMEKNR